MPLAYVHVDDKNAFGTSLLRQSRLMKRKEKEKEKKEKENESTSILLLLQAPLTLTLTLTLRTMMMMMMMMMMTTACSPRDTLSSFSPLMASDAFFVLMMKLQRLISFCF